MIGTLHRQVEKVVDHQHFGFPAFEAASIDHAGNDHLKAVDAAYSLYRHEDPMPCKQLHNKTLDTWRTAGSPALHDNITHLAYLISCAVEDR
jgi:hypothetical protein